MGGSSVIIKGQTVPLEVIGASGSLSPDASSADAFGRLRISTPSTLFDSKLLADEGPLFWDQSLESGAGITGAYDVNQVAVDISSTASTAGLFTRQTFQRFNYQPGKSQQVLMTGVLALSGLSAPASGVSRRLGLFDNDDGVFFEENEGVVYVVVRSSVGGSVNENRIPQSSWNIDNFDGSGPSGVAADWTKSQIFVIDFEWLSAGLVRFGFINDGRFAYCHAVAHENTLAGAYMRTPNLPLRWQMETTASSPQHSMRCICSSVSVEGIDDQTGISRYHSNGIAKVNATTAGTIYALIGVRSKPDRLGTIVQFTAATILSSTADDVEWLAVLNPTVAGTFTFADLDANSAAQVATGDVAGSNTVTGGTIIGGGYFSRNTGIRAPLDPIRYLGAAIDGTQEEIVLAVRGITSGLDAVGSVTWRERA